MVKMGSLPPSAVAHPADGRERRARIAAERPPAEEEDAVVASAVVDGRGGGLRTAPASNSAAVAPQGRSERGQGSGAVRT